MTDSRGPACRREEVSEHATVIAELRQSLLIEYYYIRSYHMKYSNKFNIH